MKKSWLMMVALVAPLLYIPDPPNREKIWRYEQSFSVQFREDYVGERLNEIEEEIKGAESIGHYPVAMAYWIDRQLKALSMGSHLPPVYTVYGIVGYGDEAESVPSAILRVWGLENLSAEIRKRYSGTPAELAGYDRLKAATTTDKMFWFPELKSYPMTRYLQSSISSRLWLSLMLASLLLFLQWKRVGWAVKRIFNKETLRAFSYFLALCLSFISTPALMAAGQVSKKKKEKEKIEQVVHSTDQLPITYKPPKNTLTLEVFSDFGHERQVILRFSWVLNAKTDLMLFNQNRQAVGSGIKFSLFAAGLRVRPNRFITLTSFVGPQFSLNKNRVDQITGFSTASVKSKKADVTVVNRLSWGIDGKVPFANRHVINTWVAPMPKWLTIGVEIRRSSTGINENFWGPFMRVGQFFRPGRWKRFLGGIYFYPYRDFAKGKWDLRTGITFSFAK